MCHWSSQQAGNAALHEAVMKESAGCVRALLAQPGIDSNIKHRTGRTAIMDAVYKCLVVFNQMVN